MRVPISWLKDYVDLTLTPAELADRLTFSGLEVEGIETVGSDYAGLIAAEVRTIAPHPNADKLRICKVFDGSGELSVVCGAWNFSEGAKVILAPVGCQLPNGMKIKPAKIRGEPSSGMLCAADELGLSDDHSGLMLLPSATVPGTPASQLLGPPETVLVVEVTPNRPDCLSLIGIAREVAALTGARLKIPEIPATESGTEIDDVIRVTVEDAQGCPRYTARAIRGVKAAESPEWMKKRLTLAGVRPISNLVDITNYVMLECGQPLHAFDYRLLQGGQIVVRRARPGETFATLDGVQRPITPEMLMIADAHRPVALAGIMGGAGSEIQSDTADVLLESACFLGPDIRKTVRKLNLSTESSYRFERGVDPFLSDWAGRRAAHLMVELAGGRLVRGVVDVFSTPPEPRRLDLRFQKARDLLGVALDDERMIAILASLGIACEQKTEDHCTVRIPSWRADLELEADLIEELVRIDGLDKIPVLAPAARLVPGADESFWRAETGVRNLLVGLGATEVMHYSFVSGKFLDQFNATDTDCRVVLPLPISADHTTLRNSLVPQMVDVLGRNRARQVADAVLFELGRVFCKKADGTYGEETRVCVGIMGSGGRLATTKQAQPTADEVLQWGKGFLMELCRAARIPTRKSGGLRLLQVDFAPVELPYGEPGGALSVAIEGRPAGVLTLMRRTLMTGWRIQDPVVVFEIALPVLTPHVADVPAVKPVSVYPLVMRDLAMTVDESVRHQQVVEAIRAAAPTELIDIRLFDIYRGKNLGEGRKSLAYRFTYQSDKKTLTDEEANKLHEGIMQTVTRELKAEIRAG
jgi:phenylalanyl-tRNA synthetase beta chain